MVYEPAPIVPYGEISQYPLVGTQIIVLERESFQKLYGTTEKNSRRIVL